MFKDFYSRFTNEICKNKIILIIEENTRSLLRSIPLLHFYNIKNFTYPYSWRRISDFKDFLILRHNAFSVRGILDGSISSNDYNSICIITTSKHDKYDDYSIGNILRSKYNGKVIIILNEDDASNENRLKGFIRPIKFESFIQENYQTSYAYIYNETIKYLESKYDFLPSKTQYKNLYLYLLRYIIDAIYKKDLKKPYSVLKHLLDNSLNPLFYSIIKTISDIPHKKAHKAIDAISKNIGYYYELNKSELNLIQKEIKNRYQNNEFEYEYWKEKNENEFYKINEIRLAIEKLPEQLRGILKLQWTKLINHIS